jgi:hypothetical protein
MTMRLRQRLKPAHAAQWLFGQRPPPPQLTHPRPAPARRPAHKRTMTCLDVHIPSAERPRSAPPPGHKDSTAAAAVAAARRVPHRPMTAVGSDEGVCGTRTGTRVLR